MQIGHTTFTTQHVHVSRNIYALLLPISSSCLDQIELGPVTWLNFFHLQLHNYIAMSRDV